MVINMQQWSMGTSEGTVVEWMVKVGDTVEKGDVLCEIDQAKVVAPFETPFGGRVANLIAAEGDIVLCGDPICEIE